MDYNSEPKISIIVPIYQGEKYLEVCINSILNQSYKSLEVILVDDGSTDKSSLICDHFAELDSRVKVIHKENEGVSRARNIGLKIAEGKYVGFVDCDDKIETDMYELLLKNMINTDSDISICGFKRFDESGFLDFESSKSIYEYNQKEMIKRFLRVQTKEPYFSVWCRLYKRDVLENVYFTEGIVNEDVDFSYRVFLNATKVCVSDEKRYCYNVGNESITRNKFSPRDLDLLKSWNIVLEYSKKYDKDNVKNVEFNCLRARFTLLMKYVMYGENGFTNVNKEIKTLRDVLSKNKKVILKAKGISLQRKIAFILVMLNVKFIRFLFKMKIVSEQL